MDTYFSKRTWNLIWMCLILINVIMRIPITPHEIGHDSFLIHYIADSISVFGQAKWWTHPLSIIGLYPYSIASALPFYLSAVSQSLSLEMEWAIWFVLLFLGISSSFTAYLMAGTISNNEFFKFITALVYSTSPGILTFTTWNASGRGLLLVLLPLFIYFLIKSRFSMLKYGILTITFLILLLVTHNLFYLTVPIILSFFIALIISKIQIKSSNLFGGIILLMLFIISFMQLSLREFEMDKLILSYARYIGVLGIFALGGFIFLLFKRNRTFEESFLVLTLLFFTPTMSFLVYAKFFMLPFEVLLVSYGIVNLIKISQKRNIALFILIVSFVASIGVAEFYQFGRTNIEDEQSITPFWAEDSIVNAATWTKSYTDKMMMTDNIFVSRRMLAYSGAQLFTENNQATFIQGNLGSFNVSRRSPFSLYFYSEGPYHAENITGVTDWHWYKLRDGGFDSEWKNVIFQRLDINYYIRDERYNTTFSNSFDEGTDKLFDNGKNSIWYFKNNSTV